MQRSTVRVTAESPGQAEVLALIEALDAYQQPLYPPESHHGIDVAALSRPGVIFAVARDDAAIAVGCGALVIEAGFDEIKRMYVQPQYRGQGVAQQILDFLEAQARARDCLELRLETGVLQAAALAFYRRAGFADCPPFGAYRPDPNSVFMRKALVRPG
ncbi:GNAT family N-acetyltransferase [Panacagrimonas sp.]|uniref:GNAT family N-acetyltransferase n=1 Tax=Panacagrimonas sp. TaxID=2480088 RepID=UPI003B521A37